MAFDRDGRYPKKRWACVTHNSHYSGIHIEEKKKEKKNTRAPYTSPPPPSPPTMDGPALYRSLLKAAKHWPLDTARKNRDLGAHIRHRLPVEFRALEDVESAPHADVIRRAEAELNGLVQLTSNYYKSKVCGDLSACMAWLRSPRVGRSQLSFFPASLPTSTSGQPTLPPLTSQGPFTRMYCRTLDKQKSNLVDARDFSAPCCFGSVRDVDYPKWIRPLANSMVVVWLVQRMYVLPPC